ncbi:MAG: adenosylmethionine---8-amino-7-oxononanoate aminotransferase [Pseudomonadota bacterium]|nr:adenosylmethionine---8-amino-7-oxononanoate aminotransferase [Pseudomonadota bacterium]
MWHPCTQMKQLEATPPLAIARGEGPWLIDTEGRRYLDAISSWWVNLFGHCNPRINAAITDQLGKIEHVMLAGATHEPVVELSERLAKLTGLGHAFYGSDGASATEIALKMSAHYWRNAGQPEKNGFISLKNGYHGETVGALSVTDIPLFKTTYEPLLRHTVQVPTPDARLAEAGETAEAYALRCAVALEVHLAEHASTTAAFIVEPLVQGAAGMAMYHPAYLTRARELCDRYRVHLIADEIAVGFGRTGTMFACEQAALFQQAGTHAEIAPPSRSRRSAPAESGGSVSCRGGSKFGCEQGSHPPPNPLPSREGGCAQTEPAPAGSPANHGDGTPSPLEGWTETARISSADYGAPSPLRGEGWGEGDDPPNRVSRIADFICLSKGITGGYLPLSAVLTTDDIYAAFYDDATARGFLHSHSYTGNPLACRAALAVLDIFEHDNVIAANRVKALDFTRILGEVAAHTRVRHFRHLGMIWAFDVADAAPGFSTRFHQAALALGAFIRPVGHTVYVMPPYVTSADEMRALADAMLLCLDNTEI